MRVAHGGWVFRQRLLLLFPLLLVALVALTPVESHAVGYDFTTIVDSTNSLSPDYSSRGQRKINDSGEVPFVAVTELAQNRLYKGSGGSLTHIAGPPTFFGLNFTGNGAIDNSGNVVFKGGTESDSNGIYRGSGGAVTTIITGDENPTIDGPKRQFNMPSVSNSGLIAFHSAQQTCLDSVCTAPVRGYYAIVGQSVVTLAEEGAIWSSIGGFAPVINDAGHVVFTMQPVGGSSFHLLRYDGAGLVTVENDFTGGDGYWLNNAGDVAFAEPLAVKVRGLGSTTTTVASKDDGFYGFTRSGAADVFINDSGQVAFWGAVREFQGNDVLWDGVYTGPDIINDRVLVYGDTLMGHTLGNIELLGMNNAGQMLLSVAEQGGNPWQALVVATAIPAPELHGDFSNDDVVDAADYVVWRKNVGSTNTLPNDPHGGTIGSDQYGTWRANFGDTAAGSGSAAVGAAGGLSAAVPEPTPLALLLLPTALSLLHRPPKLKY